MNLEALSGKIRPCDPEKPYAFVSYCSKDSQPVWEDVLHLQQLGYNLWIDTNLKETDDSWRTGALEAIRDIDCRLFIFYMSRSSVVSKPCLEELQCKDSSEAHKQHGGREIPWIAIEVEPVGNLREFRDSIFDEISSNAELPRERKNAMASTLTELMDTYFPNGDKIRIKSKNDPSRRYDYYQKIEENITQGNVSKLSCEELYEQSIAMLHNCALYRKATDILEHCATEKTYLPAILMLAFLYETGICGHQDHQKAEEQLMWASFQKDESQWKPMADEYKGKKQYAEAVAFYSAYAIKTQSPEGYLEASKIWMKMKNASFEFTKRCVEEAGKLGDPEGKRLYEGLKRMPEETFLEFAKNIT